MRMVTLEMKLPEDIYLTLQSAGFNREKLSRRLNQDLALRLYAEHALSLGKAAKLAGMSRADFMELLARNDIPVVEYTEEDYEDDLATIRRMLRSQMNC